MVTLFCAVVGVVGSAFPVDIDDGQSVGHMKDVINEKKKYRFPADELQLFLAKTKRGGWLPDDDPAALKLKIGVIHPDIQTMIDVEQLEATREVKDVLVVNKMVDFILVRIRN
ncbi:hypothetical protein PF004_g18713 [Phytophthora fragariae]|uniref:Crinkler effector protein N-terminal domain-containing protein n=1 Tax=Phytophthora fragariae TaxID=53985 RepID=A0A6G0NBP8_9STRA|nr:hypothetical protein PF004_g18713 [Phytophthora fragariae]